MADHKNIVIKKDNSRLFIKEFFSKPALLKEFNGYEAVARYYPVPRLLNKDSYQSDGQLIFEFDESIGLNRGLLLDVFHNNLETPTAIEKIIDMFSTIFDQTLEKGDAAASDVFFKARALKLKDKYSSFYESEININFIFNDSNILLNPAEVIDKIEAYFLERDKSEFWSVVSQSDPSDLNIGTKPVIFDYLGGGRVPLMAELSSLLWEQLAQSAILAPMYNPKMYTEHNLVYAYTPAITLVNNHLNFMLPAARLSFLNEYVRRVIMPLTQRIDYADWYHDLKNHVAMRILGVFDINSFSPEHKSLALGYLCMFYNVWNPASPMDLINLIEKHSNGKI